MKLKSIIICAVILTAAVAAYMSFDRIAVFALSKFYGIDISYKSLNKNPRDGYVFEDFKVINKKMALGFFSSRAALKPVKKPDFMKSLNIDFKFKDAHFIKLKTEKVKTMYDKLEELVAIPFEGRWRYKDIDGSVEIFSNGLTLKKLCANGKELRLLISGDIYYNNTMDADITIYFSKEILKDIPKELHSVLMKEEPEEWKSFSVKIKGDYRSPSIQISGKLFRLNIGTVTVKD